MSGHWWLDVDVDKPNWLGYFSFVLRCFLVIFFTIPIRADAAIFLWLLSSASRQTWLTTIVITDIFNIIKLFTVLSYFWGTQ
jgi:hypothetical protein